MNCHELLAWFMDGSWQSMNSSILQILWFNFSPLETMGDGGPLDPKNPILNQFAEKVGGSRQRSPVTLVSLKCWEVVLLHFELNKTISLSPKRVVSVCGLQTKHGINHELHFSSMYPSLVMVTDQ